MQRSHGRFLVKNGGRSYINRRNFNRLQLIDHFKHENQSYHDPFWYIHVRTRRTLLLRVSLYIHEMRLPRAYLLFPTQAKFRIRKKRSPSAEDELASRHALTKDDLDYIKRVVCSLWPLMLILTIVTNVISLTTHHLSRCASWTCRHGHECRFFVLMSNRYETNTDPDRWQKARTHLGSTRFNGITNSIRRY